MQNISITWKYMKNDISPAHIRLFNMIRFHILLWNRRFSSYHISLHFEMYPVASTGFVCVNRQKESYDILKYDHEHNGG